MGCMAAWDRHWQGGLLPRACSTAAAAAHQPYCSSPTAAAAAGPHQPPSSSRPTPGTDQVDQLLGARQARDRVCGCLGHWPHHKTDLLLPTPHKVKLKDDLRIVAGRQGGPGRAGWAGRLGKGQEGGQGWEAKGGAGGQGRQGRRVVRAVGARASRGIVWLVIESARPVTHQCLLRPAPHLVAALLCAVNLDAQRLRGHLTQAAAERGRGGVEATRLAVAGFGMNGRGRRGGSSACRFGRRGSRQRRHPLPLAMGSTGGNRGGSPVS